MLCGRQFQCLRQHPPSPTDRWAKKWPGRRIHDRRNIWCSKRSTRKISPWSLGPKHLFLQAVIHANTNSHDSCHKPDGLYPRADWRQKAHMGEEQKSVLYPQKTKPNHTIRLPPTEHAGGSIQNTLENISQKTKPCSPNHHRPTPTWLHGTKRYPRTIHPCHPPHTGSKLKPACWTKYQKWY